MTLDQQPSYDWRQKSMHLAWKLDRAHEGVEALAAALEADDVRSARRAARSVHGDVGAVAEEVKRLRAEQPPLASMDDPDAIGSALTIGGSGVATIALDVMVGAMVALAVTDDADEETDFLIGACVDAESAYEASTAVVRAVPRTDGPALLNLKRAFGTEGEVALRRRVVQARARVREINNRAGSGRLLA